MTIYRQASVVVGLMLVGLAVGLSCTPVDDTALPGSSANDNTNDPGDTGDTGGNVNDNTSNDNANDNDPATPPANDNVDADPGNDNTDPGGGDADGGGDDDGDGDGDGDADSDQDPDDDPDDDADDPPMTTGYATPEAAFAALAGALPARNWEIVADATTPAGQAQLISNLLTLIGLWHLDDPTVLAQFERVLEDHTGEPLLVDAEDAIGAMTGPALAAMMADMYAVSPADFDTLLAATGTLGTVQVVGTCATAPLTDTAEGNSVAWFLQGAAGWLVSATGEGGCDAGGTNGGGGSGAVAQPFVKVGLFPSLDTALQLAGEGEAMPAGASWLGDLPADQTTVSPGDVVVAYVLAPGDVTTETGWFRPYLVLAVEDTGLTLMDASQEVVRDVPGPLAHRVANYTTNESVSVGTPVLGCYWTYGLVNARVTEIGTEAITTRFRTIGTDTASEPADVAMPWPTTGYALRMVAFYDDQEPAVGRCVAETGNRVWIESGLDVLIVEKDDVIALEGLGTYSLVAGQSVYVSHWPLGVVGGVINEIPSAGLVYVVQLEYDWIDDPVDLDYGEVYTVNPLTP